MAEIAWNWTSQNEGADSNIHVSYICCDPWYIEVPQQTPTRVTAQLPSSYSHCKRTQAEWFDKRKCFPNIIDSTFQLNKGTRWHFGGEIMPIAQIESYLSQLSRVGQQTTESIIAMNKNRVKVTILTILAIQFAIFGGIIGLAAYDMSWVGIVLLVVLKIALVVYICNSISRTKNAFFTLRAQQVQFIINNPIPGIHIGTAGFFIVFEMTQSVQPVAAGQTIQGYPLPTNIQPKQKPGYQQLTENSEPSQTVVSYPTLGQYEMSYIPNKS